VLIDCEFSLLQKSVGKAITTMGVERVSILVIGQASNELIQSLSSISISKNIRFELITTTDLDSAIKLLSSENSDLVILSYTSQTLDVLESNIRKLHEININLPVIVILDSYEETLVESVLNAGAKDYLVRGQINNDIIIRRVFSVFVQGSSTNTAASREYKEFERLSTPPGTGITAQAFGVASLAEIATDTFSELIQDYAKLLHEAVESQIFKVNYNISERLRSIADGLGFLKAGPRDIVLLHQKALKIAIVSRPPEQAKIYAEEGRYLLLELMGHLVSYYRNYYVYETRNKSFVNGREPGV
jgi:DNA-binding NarL/FixJ family response regulator